MSALQTLKTWAIAWSLAVAFCVLCAFMDGPSETEALQASADISESLAAMHAAARGTP